MFQLPVHENGGSIVGFKRRYTDVRIVLDSWYPCTHPLNSSAAALSVDSYGLSLITLKRRGEIRFHCTPDVREQERLEISATVMHHERLGGPMAFVSPNFVVVGCGESGNADVWDLKSGRIVEHLNHEGTSYSIPLLPLC